MAYEGNDASCEIKTPRIGAIYRSAIDFGGIVAEFLFCPRAAPRPTIVRHADRPIPYAGEDDEHVATTFEAVAAEVAQHVPDATQEDWEKAAMEIAGEILRPLERAVDGLAGMLMRRGKIDGEEVHLVLSQFTKFGSARAEAECPA